MTFQANEACGERISYDPAGMHTLTPLSPCWGKNGSSGGVLGAGAPGPLAASGEVIVEVPEPDLPDS